MWSGATFPCLLVWGASCVNRHGPEPCLVLPAGWGGVGVGGGSVHGTLTSQEAIARVLDRVLHPPTFPGTCSCCCLLPFLEPIVLGPPHQAASWCETKENEHQTDV